MAGKIGTSGIVDGQIVYAEHVLRIINALTAVTSSDILINGNLYTTGSSQFFGTSSFYGGPSLFSGSIFILSSSLNPVSSSRLLIQDPTTGLISYMYSSSISSIGGGSQWTGSTDINRLGNVQVSGSFIQKGIGNSGTSFLQVTDNNDNNLFQVRDNGNSSFKGTISATGSLIVSGGSIGINTDNFIDINGSGFNMSLIISGSGSNTPLFIKNDINSYSEISLQNVNPSSSVSSDFIVYNDQSNYSNYYIDLGINGSTFTGSVGNSNDAYLYTTGSNFYIGNLTNNQKTFFFIGPNTGSNLLVLSQGLISISGSTTITGSLAINTKSFTGSQALTINGSFLQNADNQSYIDISPSITPDGTSNHEINALKLNPTYSAGGTNAILNGAYLIVSSSILGNHATNAIKIKLRAVNSNADRWLHVIDNANNNVFIGDSSGGFTSYLNGGAFQLLDRGTTRTVFAVNSAGLIALGSSVGGGAGVLLTRGTINNADGITASFNSSTAVVGWDISSFLNRGYFFRGTWGSGVSPLADTVSEFMTLKPQFTSSTENKSIYHLSLRGEINLGTNISSSVYGMVYNPVITSIPSSSHYGLLIVPTASLNGIGTLTPSASLHVSGSGIFGKLAIGTNQTSSTQLQVRGVGTTIGTSLLVEDNSQNPRLVVIDSGSIGINTSTTSASLDLRGTSLITGSVFRISDSSNNTRFVLSNGGQFNSTIINQSSSSFGGNWTGNNGDYHLNFGGNFTASGTSGVNIAAYRFAPMLANSSSNQTITAVLISASLSGSVDTRMLSLQTIGGTVLFTGTSAVTHSTANLLEIGGTSLNPLGIYDVTGNKAIILSSTTQIALGNAAVNPKIFANNSVGSANISGQGLCFLAQPATTTGEVFSFANNASITTSITIPRFFVVSSAAFASSIGNIKYTLMDLFLASIDTNNTNDYELVGYRYTFPVMLRSNTTNTGQFIGLQFTGSFAPSQSAVNFKGIDIKVTISESNATGSIIGIDYNPKVLILSGSHYAAIFRSGSVGIGSERPTGSFYILAPGTSSFIPSSSTVQISESYIYRYETVVSTGTYPNKSFIQSKVLTTDGTVTPIFTQSLSASSLAMWEGIVMAHRTNGTLGSAEESATYKLIASYVSTASLATSLTPRNVISSSFGLGSNWGIYFVTSSNLLTLQVSGSASANVTWHLHLNSYTLNN